MGYQSWLLHLLQRLVKTWPFIRGNMVETVTHFTVYFEGHVQGVGFRLATFQLAKGYEVTGYVENLIDGRVQLELEGDREECLGLVRALSEEMAGFIRDKTRLESTRQPHWKKFTIR
tara:strand:- start:1143 stop:1493 length:351 start_codon:yes stop_codon:yes gene_type:complete